MIGLAGLPDGAHTVEHPRGPLWLLVRKGRIVRCEWYDREKEAIVAWPGDGRAKPVTTRGVVIKAFRIGGEAAG